jgi:hypothetical protein
MYTLKMEELSISQRHTFQLVGGFLVNLAPEPKVALAGHVVYPLLRLLLATSVTNNRAKISLNNNRGLILSQMFTNYLPTTLARV